MSFQKCPQGQEPFKVAIKAPKPKEGVLRAALAGPQSRTDDGLRSRGHHHTLRSGITWTSFCRRNTQTHGLLFALPLLGWEPPGGTCAQVGLRLRAALHRAKLAPTAATVSQHRAAPSSRNKRFAPSQDKLLAQT